MRVQRYVFIPFLFTVGAARLAAQSGFELLLSAQAGSLPAIEKELGAVLRWEVLWQETPRGFRVPASGLATVAITKVENRLTYCSRELGVCARYLTTSARNWEETDSAIYDPSENDEMDALLKFEGKRRINSATASGTFEPGVYWTAKIELPPVGEIVKQYSQLHPEQLDNLAAWITSRASPDASIKSITISCFAVTDPYVSYYVDRGSESAVVSAFWSWETETWREATAVNGTENPKDLDRLRRTVEATTCRRLSFN